jgi:DNA recombination protein RmuC
LWATSRTRRQYAARLQDLDRRLAAQEGSGATVREELQRGREIIERLQTELRGVAAEKADAEARASESRAGLEEQKRLLEEAKTRLTEAFRALAADALKSSNEDFLRLAEQRFKTLTQEAAGELEARKTAVGLSCSPGKPGGLPARGEDLEESGCGRSPASAGS